MSAAPLLKFTPSAMGPEFLEAITVQRESLIQGLVDSALDREGGNRHHLLVGLRGMGKSHVLTIVTERIRAAADDSLVLAVLNEGPWATRSYAKFLAAVLGALDHPQAPSIRSSGTHEEAERLLREAIGSRRLVLVVENLDEIFRRIGPDGQKRLRAFAENWPNLLILASTPQLFAGINRHASPFYAFFRITHLDELTIESATDLLQRVARLNGDLALANFLGTEQARHRMLAVNALAGGHPRIWLLFAGCISIPAIDAVVPLFLEALDDLTPYYQSRLRELGDQQQELVLLLCEAGGALNNRVLAAGSGLPQNQVGAALGKLEDRGYVRRATLPEALNTGDARASYWELREPLMRLAFDIKAAQGRPLSLVWEFLRAWYGTQILDELGRLPETAWLAKEYAVAAFRALEENLDAKSVFAGSADEVLARVEQGLAHDPGHVPLLAARTSALLELGRLREAVTAAESWMEVAAHDVHPLELAEIHLLVNGLREISEQPILAEYAERALELADPFVAEGGEAVVVQAKAFDQLERYDAAVDAYAKASAEFPERPSLHRDHARALRALGRDAEALEAITGAIRLAPDDPALSLDCAFALRALGRLDEAESTVLRALDVHNALPWLWSEAAIIAAERGDSELTQTRLRESLRLWSRGSAQPLRSKTVALILWILRSDPSLVATSVGAFTQTSDVAELGRGLVELLPKLLDDLEAAEVWLDDWNAPALEVPQALLRAAISYVRTNDRAHLFELPAEQREIVIELLERRQDGD